MVKDTREIIDSELEQALKSSFQGLIEFMYPEEDQDKLRAEFGRYVLGVASQVIDKVFSDQEQEQQLERLKATAVVINQRYPDLLLNRENEIISLRHKKKVSANS